MPPCRSSGAKGYEGASMADLTSAMGIEKPSLYAAFGDKEQLFRQVLDHYQKGPANMILAALQEPTARRVIERLMRESADAGSDPRYSPRVPLRAGSAGLRQ